MKENRPRPDVNVGAERAKPYGLKPSPEGALPSQHGGSAPCAVSEAIAEAVEEWLERRRQQARREEGR